MPADAVGFCRLDDVVCPLRAQGLARGFACALRSGTPDGAKLAHVHGHAVLAVYVGEVGHGRICVLLEVLANLGEVGTRNAGSAGVHGGGALVGEFVRVVVVAAHDDVAVLGQVELLDGAELGIPVCFEHNCLGQGYGTDGAVGGRHDGVHGGGLLDVVRFVHDFEHEHAVGEVVQAGGDIGPHDDEPLQFIVKSLRVFFVVHCCRVQSIVVVAVNDDRHAETDGEGDVFVDAGKAFCIDVPVDVGVVFPAHGDTYGVETRRLNNLEIFVAQAVAPPAVTVASGTHGFPGVAHVDAAPEPLVHGSAEGVVDLHAVEPYRVFFGGLVQAAVAGIATDEEEGCSADDDFFE